jgi:fructose-1-phosphate kinase PfkB-like protein
MYINTKHLNINNILHIIKGEIMTSLKELIETKAEKIKYNSRGVVISTETAEVILNKINELGAFALPRVSVNKAVGWSDKALGNQRLKVILNKQHPLDGQKWHVGHATKTDSYIFTLKTI